jgi:hypothetical protein
MILTVDLTQYPDAVRERMAEIWSRENEMAMMKARIRQEQIAKFYRDNPPRWKDGVGPQEMAIDPYWYSYFEMIHANGEAWEKDHMEWLKKNDPAFAVKAVSGKVQVGYSGLAGNGRRVKSYGNN